MHLIAALKHMQFPLQVLSHGQWSISAQAVFALAKSIELNVFSHLFHSQTCWSGSGWQFLVLFLCVHVVMGGLPNDTWYKSNLVGGGDLQRLRNIGEHNLLYFIHGTIGNSSCWIWALSFVYFGAGEENPSCGFSVTLEHSSKHSTLTSS